MAKKSFYIFLTSILGALLFLIMHRLIVFVYLYLVATEVVFTGINYYVFLAWDYFSLIITMMLGLWYGIWLGLFWFRKVYEESSHGGLVHHLSKKIFKPSVPQELANKMSDIKERLEQDLWQLEDLTQTAAKDIQKISPVKRKVVRKKAPKKLNS